MQSINPEHGSRRTNALMAIATYQLETSDACHAYDFNSRICSVTKLD
jgi:hypothetical protein